MYRHHIEEMVQAIMEGFGYFPPVNEDESKVQEEERAKIRKALEEYWYKRIAIVWQLEDVLDRAKDEEIEITEDQALNVLEAILHNHDASIGVNWDVIDTHINFETMPPPNFGVGKGGTSHNVK